MRYNLNIQGFAGPIPYNITVNGEAFTIVRTRDDINTTWEIDQSANSTLYSINNSKVIWQNGGILQYNGVDVLPTDLINADSAYTTRANTPKSISLDNLKVFKEELEKIIPSEYDTAELDIKCNEDGTLTDEQITYLQSFSNLMFLKITQGKYNKYTLYRAIKVLNSTNQVNGYTFMGFPSPTQSIGGSISELIITFSAKKYKWTIRNVGAYLLTNVKYDVNSTLSDSQLSDIKRILTGGSSRAGGWLMHITIQGVNAGKDYLIYSSSKLRVNTSISFVCEGYKKMVLDLSTGAYTFEESSIDVTAQKIFDLTEDSDTVVREIDSDTGKVNIHLATPIANKVNNALQMPTTKPTELLMVGLNTNKAQTNIPLGSSLALENGHLETAIKIVRKTQEEYNNLTSYDANTMYVILG